MASSNAERRVTLRALYDSTEMRRGADDSERALKDLERTTDQTSESMNRSLRTVDDGVSSSFGRGGSLDRSLDDADQNLTEFADTAREEVPNAMLDMQDGASSAVEGLAGAFASLGPGGTVVATVLAGFTVMLNRSEAAAQKMRDAVNSALSSMTIEARKTNEQLLANYKSMLTFDAVVTEIGGGDKDKGFAKLAGYAEDLGYSVDTVVQLISNKWTPNALRLRDYMKQQLETTREIEGRGRVALATLEGQRDAIYAINQLAGFYDEKQQRSLEIAKSERDYMIDIRAAREKAALAAQMEARYTEQTLQHLTRMTGEIQKWAGRRLPDPTTG